ncbi:MAG: hypothetical protein K0Q73_1883 [Paenibacillus sp.]|jgi:hypothetical protein|nr:hypothetical protein [Paenibacillus sp.]
MSGLTVSRVAKESNVNIETVRSEEKAKAYGIKFIPAVTFNGKLIDLELLKQKDARLS